MATKALTPVAPRASRDQVSALAPGCRQDWRQLFIAQNAEAIWQSLFALIQSSNSDDKPACELKAQEAFLYLTITNRMDFYIETGYSNEEIERDLLLYLTG